MNYRRIYDEFIANRRLRQEDLLPKNRAEWQTHHIRPRSIGGDNNHKNLIRLTHADHLFAHLLLGKIYGGILWSAVLLMLGEHKIGRKARRNYQFARNEYSRFQSEKLRGKAGFMTGRKHSLEARAKQSAIKMGKKQSLETRTKRAAAMIGKKNRLGKPDSEAVITAKRKRLLGNKSRTGQTRGVLERSRCSESVKRSWTAQRHAAHQAMLKRRWG